MQTFRPKMIICGASAYPRDFDYERFRKIADSVGAYLLCDMAHVSGLVSAQLLKSPFELCDVVTTTTHKSLRGPRAGAQFCLLCRLPWLHCISAMRAAASHVHLAAVVSWMHTQRCMPMLVNCLRL